MAYKTIDLSVFPVDRERSLKAIYRYSMFETMYYRPNLWEHSHRLLWLIEALAPVAEKYLKVDIEKARTLALVHDDAEMVTGDIQAGAKDLMTASELAGIDSNEEKAVAKLAIRYPKEVNGYEYAVLLISMIYKNTSEAQLVSYVDKLDAYCESMHEVMAGNTSLLRSVMFYVKTLALFPNKYPALKEFLADKSTPLIYIDDRLNTDLARFERYVNRLPHTLESIYEDTDFPFYNEWRRVVIAQGREEGIEWLTKQREFAPQK